MMRKDPIVVIHFARVKAFKGKRAKFNHVIIPFHLIYLLNNFLIKVNLNYTFFYVKIYTSLPLSDTNFDD